MHQTARTTTADEALRRHSVLATADGQEFASLRRVSSPRSERIRLGKQLRSQVPRSALGTWSVPTGRRDVAVQVAEANVDRIERLVPVRVGRMVASPYAFLRGAAAVQAEDFARLPTTGITPVICGDAHLGNFGFYASPERELVFDLNDFDEAHPGAWEWDLRRLVDERLGRGPPERLVRGRMRGRRASAASRATASTCAHLAEQPLLGRAYERLDLDRMRRTAHRRRAAREIERPPSAPAGAPATGRCPASPSSGRRAAASSQEPPLITRPETRARRSASREGLDAYLETLPPHWARVVGGYRLVDIAHKVVGVGSVGLRAYIALCEGSSPDDVLFLQLKQARRSVVARFVHGDSAWHAHQGQRVVEYQQALQTVSDPLLGWTTVDDLQYYVRQFRDMKGAIVVDDIDADALADYAGICGHLLAKAHARTSGASMIAGYLGGGRPGRARVLPLRPGLRRPDRARPRRAGACRAARCPAGRDRRLTCAQPGGAADGRGIAASSGSASGLTSSAPLS